MARAKGFITSWAPQAKTRIMIQQIQEIMASWESQGLTPVKNRTVFYKLGTEHGYPKTDAFYKDTLNGLLTNMRRVDPEVLPEYHLDWHLLIDEGCIPPVDDWYLDPGQFWRSAEIWSEDYTIDRLAGQDRRFIVWMEAGGLIAAARKSADKYSVPVATGGRQDSYYQKRKAAQWIFKKGYPVTVFHIGDYDGKGVDIYETLRDDVTAMVEFLGGEVEFVRLGVLPEQFDQYNLGTRKAKGTKMDRKYGITTACEAEAFDPVTVAAMVENAITSRIDLDLYRQTLAREQVEREGIVQHMKVAAG